MQKSSIKHFMIILSCLFTYLLMSVNMFAQNQKLYLGPLIKETDVKQIKKEVTNQQEIIRLFGSPQKKLMENDEEVYYYELFGDRLSVEFDKEKKVYDYTYEPETLDIVTNSGFISKKKTFSALDMMGMKIGKTGSYQIKKWFGEPSIYEVGTHRERYTFYRRTQKLVILMNKLQDYVLEYTVEDLRL